MHSLNEYVAAISILHSTLSKVLWAATSRAYIVFHFAPVARLHVTEIYI